MKKILCLILISFGGLYAQQKQIDLWTIRPEYYTVTLDSTAETIVYYIFPPPAGENSNNRTAISTVAPTSASDQAKNLDFNAKGAIVISMIPDTVTAQESDSLYAYVQSLVYDKNKATWYRATNDTLFLVFDTPGTYTATAIDYLNWTHENCYTSSIGGTSGILPVAGFALTIGQYANDNAGADTKLYLGFWWLR